MLLSRYLLLKFALLSLVQLLDLGLSGSLLHFPFKCRVIMVLNVIISPALQVLGNLGPAIAVDLVVL